MRRFIRTLLILAPLQVVQSACAQLHAATHPGERWVGHDAAELIAAKGAPDLTAPLSDGRRVLTWIVPTQASVADVSASSGARHYKSECRQSFTISPQEKVMAWTYTGDC